MNDWAEMQNEQTANKASQAKQEEPKREEELTLDEIL
jgi:hypothetical protein